MKSLFALGLLALAATSSVVRAQTQGEMDDQACKDFSAADKRLNAAYQKVLAAHPKDALFSAKFRAAQRAWVAFRDAEIDALFPAKDKPLEYGSVYPMCDCQERTAITLRRIEELDDWLTVQEGDVCTGSRTETAQP